MRFRAALALASSVGVVALAPSCGGSDAASGGTPFTIWVLDERLTLDAQETPVANARVAYDPPDGSERVTKMTEADGHVTFDGDFTHGGASITVLSDDHVFVTMLEASPDTARAQPNTFGKPESDLVVVPPRLDRVTAGRTVGLRGNIFGKSDPDDVVSIAASSLPRLGAYQALESTFIFRVPRDRPFYILGHETKTLVDANNVIAQNDLIKSFRIELPARSDDELLDLDLPTVATLPAKLIHVHAEAPQVATSPFGPGTRASASVGTADSGLIVGVFAATAANANGHTFDVDVNLVDTDVTPERPLSQVILTAPDGSLSTRTEQGTMADGTVWTDFPLPPTIPDPDTSRTLLDPIPLDGFPAGADLEARLYAAGELLWILRGPPGGPHAKSFTIPYRREVTDIDVQLIAMSVTAETGRVALPLRGELYRYSATFRDVFLRKP
jgi:hypothetical protein